MPQTTNLEPHSEESQLSQSGRGHTDPTVLLRLLDEWMQGDEAEQRATFQALRRALDEDRAAGYRFFS